MSTVDEELAKLRADVTELQSQLSALVFEASVVDLIRAHERELGRQDAINARKASRPNRPRSGHLRPVRNT